MSTNQSLPAPLRALTEQERSFVRHFVRTADKEAALAVSGYRSNTSHYYLLHRPDIAAAVRAEQMRLLVVEGGTVALGSLIRIAQDTKAPAAAQVAAAKALLQGAGLLEQAEKPKDSKSITDMSREELRAYIESKQADIARLESELADRAKDVTPISDPQVSEMLG